MPKQHGQFASDGNKDGLITTFIRLRAGGTICCLVPLIYAHRKTGYLFTLQRRDTYANMPHVLSTQDVCIIQYVAWSFR